jgi:hypothetical protein
MRRDWSKTSIPRRHLFLLRRRGACPSVFFKKHYGVGVVQNIVCVKPGTSRVHAAKTMLLVLEFLPFSLGAQVRSSGGGHSSLARYMPRWCFCGGRGTLPVHSDAARYIFAVPAHSSEVCDKPGPCALPTCPT